MNPMPPTPPAGRRRCIWQTLLMAAGLLFLAVALSASGCHNARLSVVTSTGQSLSSYQRAVRSGVRQQANGPAYHTLLMADFEGPPFPTYTTITFTPPPGATGISFDWEPSGQYSDGTYYWNISDPGGFDDVTIVADYTVSGDPTKVVATVAVGIDTWDEKVASSHSYQPPKGGGGVAGLEAGPEGERGAAVPALAKEGNQKDADDYYLWHVHPYFWPSDLPLTQGLCQDLLDLLQSPDFFVAVRMPIYPPSLPYTEPYTLPVIFQEEISPTLSLIDRTVSPWVTLLSLPLDYRPEFFAFLETELPEAPDAHWLALSPAADPPASCAGLPELPADGWGLKASLDLDLGGVQGEYRGRTLLFYLCYRGQDPPFFFEALGGRPQGVAPTYQGWGITALGPAPVHLFDDTDPPPFEIWPQHIGYFTPTATISMPHSVWNLTGTPQTVDVEFQGSLGLPWGLYADAGGTQPLPVPARLELPPWGSSAFYLIAALPLDAPSGMEKLLITATDAYSPTLTSWVSDVVWVGEWLPPPPPPGRRIFLPLVMRNW